MTENALKSKYNGGTLPIGRYWSTRSSMQFFCMMTRWWLPSNYKEGTDTITFDDLKASPATKTSGSDMDCLTAPAHKFPPQLVSPDWIRASVITPARRSCQTAMWPWRPRWMSRN